MKKLSILLFSLAVMVILSGCATRKVVIIESGKPAPPTKTTGQVIAAQNHVNNGVKQLNKGHFKQAAEQFHLAIQKDPNNWEAHYWLGLTYQRWKRYRESTDYFILAIDMNPRDKVWVSKCRMHLGITFEYQGRFRDAEREYQLSVTLNPKNREASERWQGVSKKMKNKSKDKYNEKKHDQDHDDDHDEYGEHDD